MTATTIAARFAHTLGQHGFTAFFRLCHLQFFCLLDGFAIDALQLDRFLQDVVVRLGGLVLVRLPVTSRIIVRREPLPKNPTGKLLKNELRRCFDEAS